MRKRKLLDLFCGAGGCSRGYAEAGFDVYGVDLVPQPRYPYPFVRADALAFVARYGHQFDAIHASPPCQGYSRLRHLPWLKDKVYPLLIDPCRELLIASGKAWVMENVEDSPLGGIILCGLSFDLPLYRHRRFESSIALTAPEHTKHTVVIGSGRRLNDRRMTAKKDKHCGIVTVASGLFTRAQGERAMGIDWMTCPELAQAIPPAYTRYVGLQLLEHLK